MHTFYYYYFMFDTVWYRLFTDEWLSPIVNLCNVVPERVFYLNTDAFSCLTIPSKTHTLLIVRTSITCLA